MDLDMENQQLDHDVLIELRTEMRAIRADIKELKDGTSGKITDHENRIRLLESDSVTCSTERVTSMNFTRIGGAILIFAVGIAQFIIGKYF